MAKFDLHHGSVAEVAFKTYLFAGNEAKVGEIIDTLGYESIEYYIISGTLTTGTFTPSIEDGDDSALSDAAAISADYLLGTYADATLAVTDDDTTKQIGTVGKKRYQRLTITGADTAAGTVTVAIVKAAAWHKPTQGSDSPTG